MQGEKTPHLSLSASTDYLWDCAVNCLFKKNSKGVIIFLGKVYRMTLYIQTETFNPYFNISWVYF